MQLPFLSIFFALTLAAGMVHAQSPIKIVTTTTDLESLVVAVGGHQVAVESIASPDQDPHTMELKPAQLLKFRDAQLIVRIGLDHEPWLARVKSAAPVLNVSHHVKLIQTETPRLRAERRAHVHAHGNTHYWLDPENARPIAAAIASKLSELSPANRTQFEANREAFLRKLDSRLQEWKAAMAPYAGVKAVVMHDSWSYFAKRFGIDIVAAAEPTPGVPPSPAELARLYARMQEASVRLLIADPHSNQALVRQVSEKGKAAPVVLVPSVRGAPQASDYLALIDFNIKQLVEVLR